MSADVIDYLSYQAELLMYFNGAESAAGRLNKGPTGLTAASNLYLSVYFRACLRNSLKSFFNVWSSKLQTTHCHLLEPFIKLHSLSVFLSLSSAVSLPWRVQVQGELAPKQLQRLWVSGVQRLLHSTQQAWPCEEGQQGHHCHDCNALPTPNMTSKDWQ